MNKTVQLATWNPNDKVTFAPNFTNQPLPRFFRVGMNPSAPWMFFKTDKKTGQRLLDGKGNYIFDGYCVKLLKEMAKRLQFEYEIVLSSDYEKSGYEYGRKLADGTWSGLIGDLSSGDIDIVVADLTMTSEREEIIDYVSPYFDQVLSRNSILKKVILPLSNSFM
jgi:ionotropic glutamate receptor